MQGEQLLQNPDFAKTLAKSPFKPEDLPKISSSVADTFDKMSPELRTSMKGMVANLEGLSLPELKALLDTVDYIEKNKAQYPKVMAQLVQAGTVQQGDFPDKYDPKVMLVVRTLIGQAILKKRSDNQPSGYAHGGIVSLKGSAKKVQSAGRNGDSVLAHINPREAAMLKRAGGSGATNPKTGLPEFGFNLGGLLKVAAQFVATAAVSYFVGPAAAGAIVGGVSSLLSGGKPADALKSALIGGAMGGIMGGISSVSSGGGFWAGATAGGSLTGSAPYETWLSKGLSGTSVGSTLFPGNPADARAAEAAAAAATAGDVKPVTGGTGGGASTGGANTGAAAADTGIKPATSSYDNLAKWASDYKLPLIGLAGAGVLAASAMNKDEVPTTNLTRSETGTSLLEKNPEKYGFDNAKFMGEGIAREVKPVTAPGNYVKTDIPDRKPPAFYDYTKVQYPDLFSGYQQPQFAKSGILNARVGGPINGPGTGTSDSIPARLSDGEFVMTAKAVRGAGDGSRKAGARNMYDLMHKLERRA